jgi:acyl-ACP thioesterase
MRDFRLEDAAGRVLLVATSRWLLVDIAKGLPRRIESLARDLVFENVEHAIEGPLEKIVAQSPCLPVYDRAILSSDLDVNHHVNNAEYAKWVIDCFDVQTQTTRALHSVQLNYLEETLFGDRVHVGMARKENSDASFYVEGRGAKENSLLFQAQVDWT